MPLLKQFKLENNCVIGIWEITEEVNELNQYLDLQNDDKVVFESLKSDRRKREWLAVRCLYKKLNPSGRIDYKRERPIDRIAGKELSISHTKGICCVYLAQKSPVGIDVEQCSEKALRVANKFLSNGELNLIDVPKTDLATLIWTVKEAIFKKYSRIKHLNFKSEIIVKSIVRSEQLLFDVLVDVQMDKLEEQSLKVLRLKNSMMAYTVND